MERIVVKDVGKRFRRYHPERPWTLIEAVTRGFRHLKPAEQFWALRDINFAVGDGETVGIIGKNGAGKSTLLRLIGGVGRPDHGAIRTNGRIGALLELGAGFHPDLTGRENILVSGVISGLTRREVLDRFDSIVDFAELEAFIDSPLRTYSTGMQMRLAFAVAVHIEPEILLIDEVLAVGDINFQNKCLQRIARFKEQGCTVLLVSHEAGLVEKLCDRAIWLRGGEIAAQGTAEMVVGQYVTAMASETKRRTPLAHPPKRIGGETELTAGKNRFGSLEMEISAVTLTNDSGQPVAEIEAGDPVTVNLHYHAPTPISEPIFSVTISREDGFICYDTNSALTGAAFPSVKGHGSLSLRFQRLDLAGGRYFIDVGVHHKDWAYAYDYHWHVYPLLISGSGGERGILQPPNQWKIEGRHAIASSLSASDQPETVQPAHSEET